MSRHVRRWMRVTAAVLAAGIAAAPLASSAQEQDPGLDPCPNCGPGARGGPMHARPRGEGRMFDPSTVTTVQGAIESLQTRGGRRARGVHLTLAAGSEKLQVVVGPTFYLDQQPVKLAQGDTVEVKGSRTTWGGQPVLIAQEIRKGDQVLTLRDADGIPLWSRARPRP